MSGQVFRGDRESLSPTMDSYEYSGVTREDLQERYTNPNFANFLSVVNYWIKRKFQIFSG